MKVWSMQSEKNERETTMLKSNFDSQGPGATTVDS